MIFTSFTTTFSPVKTNLAAARSLAPSHAACPTPQPDYETKQARVGFTVIAGTTTFSPVKTNLVDARAKSVLGEPTYSAGSGPRASSVSLDQILEFDVDLTHSGTHRAKSISGEPT